MRYQLLLKCNKVHRVCTMVLQVSKILHQAFCVLLFWISEFINFIFLQRTAHEQEGSIVV
jgi:hypothetical protein